MFAHSLLSYPLAFNPCIIVARSARPSVTEATAVTDSGVMIVNGK